MIALYKCMKNIKSSQSFDLLNEHLKIYTIHENPKFFWVRNLWSKKKTNLMGS